MEPLGRPSGPQAGPVSLSRAPAPATPLLRCRHLLCSVASVLTSDLLIEGLGSIVSSPSIYRRLKVAEGGLTHT